MLAMAGPVYHASSPVIRAAAGGQRSREADHDHVPGASLAWGAAGGSRGRCGGVHRDRHHRHRQVRARQGERPPAHRSPAAFLESASDSVRLHPADVLRHQGGAALFGALRVPNIRGDGDPMDICILTEKSMAHANFFLRARPIGGLRMIDGEEADDKIVAVLERDMAYGDLRDIADAPQGVIERLRHYFLTYKQMPGEPARTVRIAEV